MDRRIFMAGLAGLPLLRPARLVATEIGAATLTTVSDGNLVLPASFQFEGIPPEQAEQLRAEFGLAGDQVTPPCNLALFQDGENTVLFDVGSGPDFMPSAGKILESLDAAGLSAEDITHVVFTHAHPDHIWGLVDDFDELTFPEATYLMGRAEWDYWWNPETVDSIDAERQSFAVGAKRRLEYIENAVQLFEDDEEILPGIAAVATFGHTPGHMSFEVRNGSDAAMIVGDALVNHHLAFARPGLPGGSDQDPETAAATRERLLDRLTSEQLPLVGFHLPEGGIGRAEKVEDGYRYVPEGA